MRSPTLLLERLQTKGLRDAGHRQVTADKLEPDASEFLAGSELRLEVARSVCRAVREGGESEIAAKADRPGILNSSSPARLVSGSSHRELRLRSDVFTGELKDLLDDSAGITEDGFDGDQALDDRDDR